MKQLAPIALIVMMVTALPACKPSAAPPLPPELAAIHCPVERKAHAQVSHTDQVQVRQVCLTPEQAAHPELIWCHVVERRPNGETRCRDQVPVAREWGELALSRTQDMQVYGGAIWATHGPAGAKDGPERIANMTVSFKPSAQAAPWHDQRDRAAVLTLASGDLGLPAGFVVETGIACDARSTVLEYGTCRFRLRSASMSWDVSIQLRRARNTAIPADAYRDELRFFLPYLGRMASDSPAR